MNDHYKLPVENYRYLVSMTVPAGMEVDANDLAEGLADVIDEANQADRFFGAKRLHDGDTLLLRLSVERAGAMEPEVIDYGAGGETPDLPFWNALTKQDLATYKRITNKLKSKIDLLDVQYEALVNSYYKAKAAPNEEAFNDARAELLRQTSSAQELLGSL